MAVVLQSKYERVLSIEKGMDSSENPLQATTAPSSSAADPTSSAAASSSQSTPAVSSAPSSSTPAASSAFARGGAEPRPAGYDEESAQPRGPVARLKGMSPSSSQQLELDDALASTAELDGPCADKPAGCAAACASCLHCCGDACPFHPCVSRRSLQRPLGCSKSTLLPK